MKTKNKGKSASPVDALVMPELIPVEKREDTFLSTKGVRYKCVCGGNLFEKVEIRKSEEVYRCKSCGERHRSKIDHIPDGGKMVEIVDMFMMYASQAQEALRGEGDFPHPWNID